MTKTNSAFPISPSAIIWLLLVALALVVYFAGLTMPLLGPDEPRYAQVAREMFERGDWVTPTLGGFNWFEKPALLYWLEIAAYNVFGVTEFAARLGSALFGLGTIASLWILGKHVDVRDPNDEQPATDSFANWIGLIAASTIGIIAFAHGASFDIILTFPITAALVSYFVYDLHGRTRWLAAFYFFIGVAILAKGLVGILFPFSIVGFYHVLAWKIPSKTVALSLLWGSMLATVIAATWYLPMYVRHGWEFIDQFFVQHHFQRYTSNKYLHPQPFHFFLWVLPLMTVPWLPFFVASLWNEVRRFVSPALTPSSRNRRSLIVFAFAWMTVPLVFFSFSGSKLPGYILPAVPATIIFAAVYVDRFVRNNSLRAYAIQAIAGATFVLTLVAMFVFVPDFARADSVKGLFATARSYGYGDAPVLMLHRISHNAEFYAAGKIVRNADGKPKQLFGPAEVLREVQIRRPRPVLVLVPVEYLNQLLNGERLRAELIGDNGEWALVLVGETQILISDSSPSNSVVKGRTNPSVRDGLAPDPLDPHPITLAKEFEK